jgi:hypothetical protein
MPEMSPDDLSATSVGVFAGRCDVQIVKRDTALVAKQDGD